LKQLYEVAGRIGEKYLPSARAGNYLAAKRQACAAQPVDLGVQVVDD
jgi:hypothetical protein